MLFLLAFLYFSQGSSLAAPAAPLLARDVPTLVDSPTCTCPADQRSLMDIIWSCLSTIFLCSWVAVHPNIPYPGAPWYRPALTRLELMAWTIISPELMIFWAMRQWVGARKMHEDMKKVYPGWTKTHGYFLQMGGFMLFDGDICKGVLGYFPVFYGRNNGKIDFLRLLQEKKIHVPYISQDEIQDRSKGDVLAKTIVLGQTSWFIAQCISRRAEGLVTTELELVTLAFAVLNGFMYFFWWDKPLDVRTSVPVYLIEPSPPADVKTTVEEQPPSHAHSSWRKFAENVARLFIGVLFYLPWVAAKRVYLRLLDMSVFDGFQASEEIKEGAQQVHTFFAITTTWQQANTMQAVVSVIGVLFGAIHCAGWNFEFPSTVYSILWRASSLTVTVIPLLMVLRYLLLNHYFGDFGEHQILEYFVWPITVYIGLPLYILARIILLVLACIALRHLSPSALAIVEWSSFLPHI